MLTPMQIQYVVGLCTLGHDPNAVDITVGDMVLDPAAGKERDVDVTVTLKNEDGSVSAFKAYEAKREGDPLDVVTTEQLSMKLKDMPSLTHRSIVSTSGFTVGSIKKAKAHGIALYSLKPWTKPLAEQFPEFPGVGTPQEFLSAFSSNLLYWINARFQYFAPSAPGPFRIADDDKVLCFDGKPHGRFRTFKDLQDALMRRSTEILFGLEPAQTILRTYPLLVTDSNNDFAGSAAWPHTHTLDVTQDGIYILSGTELAQTNAISISGFLQWRRRTRIPDFQIMEDVSTGEVFAAAAVADYGSGDGRMFAMVFQPNSRNVNVHLFELLEKHKNAIRKLKIPPLRTSSDQA